MASTADMRGSQHVSLPQTISNVYLQFQGIGFSTGKVREFQVIAGSQPPTITGGYAQYEEYDRPLQRGLTIFKGYKPVTMTVSVIFGQWVGTGWKTDDDTGRAIRQQIAALEWMGGSNFQAGPSPVVYIFCQSTSGGQTDLIPAQYQSTSKSQFPWIITGLSWGTTYRNPAGYRVWQEATITVENYLNLGVTPPPKTQQDGGYFRTTGTYDKPILIAGAPSVRSPVEDHRILARRICESSRNNPCKGTRIKLNRKGIYYQIRTGVHVWVPGHSIT